MGGAGQELKCALRPFTGPAYELGAHLIESHDVDPKMAILGIKGASEGLSMGVERGLKGLIADWV